MALWMCSSCAVSSWGSPADDAHTILSSEFTTLRSGNTPPTCRSHTTWSGQATRPPPAAVTQRGQVRQHAPNQPQPHNMVRSGHATRPHLLQSHNMVRSCNTHPPAAVTQYVVNEIHCSRHAACSAWHTLADTQHVVHDIHCSRHAACSAWHTLAETQHVVHDIHCSR